MRDTPPEAQFLLLAARDTGSNEPARDKSDEIAYILKVTLSTIRWLERLQHTARKARQQLGLSSLRMAIQKQEFQLWKLQLPPDREENKELAEQIGKVEAQQVYEALSESRNLYKPYQPIMLPEMLAYKLEESPFWAHKRDGEIALTQKHEHNYLEVEPHEEWTSMAAPSWEDLLIYKIELADPNQVPQALMKLVEYNPDRALKRLKASGKRPLEGFMNSELQAQLLKALPPEGRQEVIRLLGQKPSEETGTRERGQR